MTSKPLVIFGTGDLAEMAAYYFERSDDRRVAAFTVDAERLAEPTFCGRPVIPFEDIHTHCPPTEHDAFVAVGYSQLNAIRKQKCLEAISKGYELASYVSRHATIVGDVSHGWNCFIVEGCVVQMFARIGNGVILRSGSFVSHHTDIGDFVFIAPRAAIAGRVRIGERTFVGINATINDHVTVGARCIIASGTIVNCDIPDDSVTMATRTTIASVRSSDVSL